MVEKGGMGGQAGVINILDNIPGFYAGIACDEFAPRFTSQVKRFDAEILQAQEISNIFQYGPYWYVTTANGQEYDAKVILLATGESYSRLNVPGEEELLGTNIHFCATCDGESYKGKKILVIGGGNSGFEEGLFLTRFADQVDIVEHMSKVKASRFLQEQVARNNKMSVTVNYEVKAFKAKHHLEAVVVEVRDSGEIKEWDYDGVFVFIGLTTNSSLVNGLVETKQWDFVKTDQTLMTSVPGLFAAGDARDGSAKQAAAAAGEGDTAALMIRECLMEVG